MSPPTDSPPAAKENKHPERKRTFNPAERYLGGVNSLPPAPTLLSELLVLFKNLDQDIDKVVGMISYEPALTAQIHRTCNSAYYAGEQPPSDIFEAVSRIGFYQVYCLVVSYFGAKTTTMPGTGKGVDVDALWRHAVAAAVSASLVAEETGQIKAMGFTAGLLHDIGKLVLASGEREAYARVIERARFESVPLSGLERTAFGIDHAELGGELLERWKLPPEIATAVRYHHELEAAPVDKELVAAVQIGDVIAHQLFTDLANTGLLKTSDAPWQILQMSPEDLPRLLARSRSEMENVKGMLDI